MRSCAEESASFASTAYSSARKSERYELVRRERLDRAREVGRQPLRRGDGQVVEEVLEDAFGGLPPSARLGARVDLPVLLDLHLDLIVESRVRRPRRVRGGVERPERDVDALQLGERGFLREVVRPEPE